VRGQFAIGNRANRLYAEGPPKQYLKVVRPKIFISHPFVRALRVLPCLAALAVLLFPEHSSAVLRILPLGDSITDGFSVPGGYRMPLFQLCTNAGYSVRFLGTQTNNGAPGIGNVNHEGHSGFRIDEITAGISGWLESVDDPDVILLLIGTNDYGQKHDPDQAINRLDELIARIETLRPSARLIVANLLQRTDNAAADNAIQREFNPYVPKVVARHATLGQRVWFLDLRRALAAEDLIDGLHPNQTGYDKMAACWFDAIRKIVANEQAGLSVVDFDGACLDGSLNHVLISPVYQPVRGLKIGYENVGIFNQGPDHTSGISGGTHYSTFSFDGATPQVFTFNRAVSIPSVCLTTFSGMADGDDPNIRITAYADANGAKLITNLVCAVPPHHFGGNYQWTKFTGLKDLGTSIMRVDFFSTGNAQVDDLAIVVSTNLGSPKTIEIQLPVSEVHEIGPVQLKTIARYADDENTDVTSGAGVNYQSGDTNVLTISRSGLITGVHAGGTTVTATLNGLTTVLPVNVMPGAVLDFNAGLNNDQNRQSLTADYQPVADIHIGYENVGLFNGGPDHTTGVLGANHFNTYQFRDGVPQVFTFSKPVSVPSLWLTAYTGVRDQGVITAWEDEKGEHCLGTVLASTPTFPGEGKYLWGQCTNLNSSLYNGRIRRLEISSRSGVNVNVDDISVVVSTNSGTLKHVQLQLPPGPFYAGKKVPVTVIADYEHYADSLVTSGCGVVYRTSNSGVVTIDTEGMLTVVGSGRATITASLGTEQSSQEVEALPGHLLDFSVSEGDIGNYVAIPEDYQPVPDLVISYDNVGLFNGGPDHTAGKPGGNNYNAYQFVETRPQAFSFCRPVSIPMFYLATYEGSGAPVTVSAYADSGGKDLIGAAFVAPARSSGRGGYVWTQCTNFDSIQFTGKIRRLEIFGADDANLDDLVVEVCTNLGKVLNISFSLPVQLLVPGMSRQASVMADFELARQCDVTRLPDTAYQSSDTNVVVLDHEGVVHAVGPGQAQVTARFQGFERSLQVKVQSVTGRLIHFNDLTPFENRILIPPSYQPVPDLKLSYVNVGLYNGGPDHTSAIKGGNNFNAYQYRDGSPQVFIFNKPVSLPSFWLSTYWGSGDQITVSAFDDPEGKDLLGSSFVTTATFAGPGNYNWVECTNLNTPVYHGRIRRLELSDSTGNAQLDDMQVQVP